MVALEVDADLLAAGQPPVEWDAYPAALCVVHLPRAARLHDGGRVVFEGAPAHLVADRSTLTGEHLADYVSA